MKLKINLSIAISLFFLVSTSYANELKVGLITTLSGGGAALGIDIRDGFLLGVEQAGGGNISVVVEDDQRKPDIAIKVADKMIQSEDVDVLTGIVFSNIAMAVVPSSLSQGKFYISPNAGPSLLAGKRCHKNYFNVAWQNDNLHEAAGEFANAKQYKNSFIMAPNYPAGRDALNGYKRLYRGELAGEIKTKLGQTDYASEIAQIRASGADSVYFFLPGGMGVSFLKQYADSGVGIPLIGPAFSFDQTILAAVGEAAEGVSNTSQWNKDLDNEANKAFVASFKEKYGRLPSLYASQGFDAAVLLANVNSKVSISNPDQFRAELEKADFSSVRGGFEFGPNHHPIQDYYVREVVKEDGIYTNKVVSTVLSAHADAYSPECKF
ncbi:ABC transporter substrate-binding protein [Grimontia marina]|uniref:Leucine-, isoleucine-, valine-, threonine-, and alanine-binding protein n=1 Tax=Grimontia marina TaxID=646534 RepID=A0A128F0V0_9GAMM|nr:ABC transporter substrate-binding protein [Grimontia marina]CZF80034.1 Leucine-, isoleucine-, valine-, threonine-, and alanine-binding protein precursor [Grimontia marina]